MQALEVLQQRLPAWRADPCLFIREALRDPETNAPFELYEAEERFIRELFRPMREGGDPYREVVFAAPKKSGKTALAALVILADILLFAGPYGEALCLASSLEQSTGRVFRSVARICEKSPLLRQLATIGQRTVTFDYSGAIIQAISSDYASAAGSNADCAVFDELWSFDLDRDRKLFEECVPPPTKPFAFRLTVTYAGWKSQTSTPTLLESLYERGIKGELIG